MARKPLREIDVEVSRLGSDGFGVADIASGPVNGIALEREVRIKNALPGERVEAKVLKRRRGLWLAEAQRVLASQSPNRVAPPCANFPRCGGCAMQHLHYDEQILLKQKRLEQALSGNGIVPESWVAPRLGPRLHYRTKARFGVRRVGERVLVGFRESFSNRVGRMDDCCTLIPAFSDMLPDLKDVLTRISIPGQIPQIEVAAGDTAQALLVRHLAGFTAQDEASLVEFADRHDISLFSQPAGYDSIQPMNRITDSPYLGYANPDYGLYFHFLPWDFTQVNLAMNRSLVRSALLALAVEPGAVVVDLFCGIGNFSLALAVAGAKVRGLEASAGAVERAQMNAQLNGLDSRCEFLKLDLYDPACRSLGEAQYLLLDPPRSGAGVNLGPWLASSRPERAAYVSCDPGSFATDAATFKQHGYVLEQVGIYDMFPHTSHVETLGLFVRSSKQR